MPTAVPTFVNDDVEDLVEKLTTEEKISLLGAPSWWSTTPIPRLGIPAVRMRCVWLILSLPSLSLRR